MKNTLTKVLTIVALCLFSAIAITAIVLAIVKRDYNQVVNSDVISIEVKKAGASNVYLKDDTEEENRTVFNDLLNKYYQGTKESILSSLFQGAYSSDAEAEVVKTTTTVSSLSASSEVFYLRFYFYFSICQTLKINNKVYEDTRLTTLDKTVKFKSVILKVENNTTLNKVTMYIVDSSYPSTSYYQVKYTTHHSALFDYIEDLEYPGL